MNLKFTIIIPIFNEVEAIFPLIDEIMAEFIIEKPEIIIVNDGSTDEFNNIFKKNVFLKNIKVINHKKNLGKCMAMLTGVKHAKNHIIAIMDGDGQNPPSEVRKLLKYWNEKNKYSKDSLLICGHRIDRKDNIVKRLSSKVANKVRRFVLNDDCFDTACALKVFKKKNYLEIPYIKNMHRFLPALFKIKKSKIINIAVIDRPRVVGKSKYNFNNRFWVGINDLIKVRSLINKEKE